jgi:hypothetical protein
VKLEKLVKFREDEVVDRMPGPRPVRPTWITALRAMPGPTP